MLRFILATLVLTALAPATSARGQAHWPQWRGPAQNGVSSSTGLPVTWGPQTNVVWATALPSWSGGTPVIWGDRIFVTSPSAPDPAAAEASPAPSERRGRRGRGGRGGGRSPGGDDLLLLCLSVSTGDLLWQHTLDTGNRLYRKGNNTSPSPVTDGSHVWVVTGTGAVTALDMDGAVIWSTNLQESYGRFGLNWGYASSPLLHEDLLVVEVLHGMRTDDPSYVVGFDAKTGAVRWRQERVTDAPAEAPDAYTTPVIHLNDGTPEIIITGGDCVTAHDPATGRELWRVNALNPRKAGNYRIVASPVAVDGMIYAPSRVKPVLALRGQSDGPAEIAWTYEGTGGPDVPTPVCDGTHVYLVNDAGMVTCLDAKTGAVVWGPERTVRGTVSSSPVLADGRLYFTNEEAVTVVVKAGPEFELLATNELDGSYTLSSPVPVGEHLFIRTGTHLYRLGSQAATTGAAPAPGKAWARWRGPDGTGISTETGWSPRGAEEPVWRKDLGLGYSSVAIAGGRLVTTGHDEARELDTIYCLDAASGAAHWTREVPCKIWDRAHGGGTLTTPLIEGDRVYVLNREGKLHCLRMGDGGVIWKRDLMDAGLGLEYPTWGFSCSPMRIDDMLVLNLGSLIALDPDDGTVKWTSRNTGHAYSTPELLEHGGRRYLVNFNSDGVSVVDLAGGRDVAFHEWKTKYDINAATPIVMGSRFFISSGQNRGCGLFEFTGDGLEVVWENKEMSNKMSGCVLWEGHLYGFDDKILKCIDLAGNEKWRQRGLGMGSLMLADGKLIVVVEGELIIATATPDGFEPLARRDVLEGGVCWTMPVLLDGLIYCRNSLGNLVCLDHRARVSNAN